MDSLSWTKTKVSSAPFRLLDRRRARGELGWLLFGGDSVSEDVFEEFFEYVSGISARDGRRWGVVGGVLRDEEIFK